ncbi:MAG: hypothetical protein WCJ94_02545 [bacterium]
MKKLLFFVIIILALKTSAYALTYCDVAGDSLAAWKVQAEYKEKYFEYNTIYHDGAVTTGIMLRGMDQDFVLRMGLPDSFFVSVDANYVFQNLEALLDHNNVQMITLLAGKQFDMGLGVILGYRIPLALKLENNPLLINRNEMHNLVVGLYQKGSLWFVKYSLQALAEQAVRPSDYQNGMDLAASLGFNFFNDPEKQSVDMLAEINYSVAQRTSGNSYVLTLIPQTVVKFYNDFNLVLGIEILLDANNMNLNKLDKLLYVVKVNYVLNGTNNAPATTAWQTQVNPTLGIPLTVTPTAEVK